MLKRVYHIFFNKLFFHWIVLVFLLSLSLKGYCAGPAVITPATGGTSLCTSFVTLGNIVITETDNNDMLAQISQTLILTAPAGYEFNPGVGTVTANGAGDDIAIISSPITSSTITITITVTAPLNKNDVITISGIQAKASSSTPVAASGNILSSGTAVCDGITNGVTNFGTLTQGPNMIYSTSTIVQSNTNNVAQNTNDNEILRIEVVMTNSCTPVNATIFTLNTTGTSSTSNSITTAKIYSTGTSPVFATSTLFGSESDQIDLNAASYIILGTASLSAGTNYFWLTYDVPAGATSTLLLDGQCTAITIDGVGQSTPTVEPYAGSRTIGITNINSNGTGNWNLTTSWVGSVVPTASNHVTILNGHVITVTDAQSAVDITVNGGASGGQLNITTGTLTIWGNVTVTAPGTMTSTSTSTLVVNDLGGKPQLVVPAGMINLKKLTINRSTGAWSNHDIRLDVTDVTAGDPIVLVLTNGILMMNANADGSGVVKNLFMEDKDVADDIPSSDASHVDGRIFRKIDGDGAWTYFPAGNKGEGRRMALEAGSVNADGNRHSVLFQKVAHCEYLDFSAASLPGGVTDKFYWEHDRISSANIARRFYYKDSDFPSGYDMTKLRIANYSTTSCPSGTWGEATTGMSINTVSKYMEQTGENASNNMFWSWGSDGSPLPITFTDFKVKIISDKNVLLLWETKSEKNNKQFSLEKSRNGIDFEEFGSVPGAGNSNQPIEYKFSDDAPFVGLSYYRIKQTDFDGNYIYFDMKAIYLEPKSFEVNKIFPNPAGGNAFIDIYSESEKDLTIKVVNNLGVVVKEIPHKTEKGSNLVEVDLNDLGGGVYFMQVNENSSHKKPTTDQLVIGHDNR